MELRNGLHLCLIAFDDPEETAKPQNAWPPHSYGRRVKVKKCKSGNLELKTGYFLLFGIFLKTEYFQISI